MIGLRSIVQRSRLLGDRRGNVSLVFALCAIPVIGAIGLAIDFGMQVRMRNDMQHALDAAVLAGAIGTTANQDLASMVSERAGRALDSTGMHPSISVSVDPANGTITAHAEVAMGTLFLGLFGDGQSTVRAMSTAVAGAGGPMEVAIAFDTTHSMAGSKLAAAQQAANDLTDLLYKVPGSTSPNPNMKVGLVPFTYYVNVGLAHRNAPWLNGAADYSTNYDYCSTTYEQLATPVHVTATCYNDGAPYDCSSNDANDYAHPISTTCTPQIDVHLWQGCVGSQNDPADAEVAATAGNQVPALFPNWDCPAQLIRLNSNPAVIKTAINGLTEGGETYIAPGLLWGWRLLSPDPASPFRDGGPIATTKKRLILMTDGANTHSASYPDHWGSDVDAANAKTLALCEKIKLAGIEIYAIAFQVTDPTAQDVLSQCASGPPFYFNALTISDMNSAFSKIGHELTAMRLTH